MKKYLSMLTLCLMAFVCLICGCDKGNKYDKLNLIVYEGNTVITSETSVTVEMGDRLDLKVVVDGMKDINYDVNISAQDRDIAAITYGAPEGKTTAVTILPMSPGKTVVDITSAEYSDKSASFTLYVNNALSSASMTYDVSSETLVYTSTGEIDLKDYINLVGADTRYAPTVDLTFTATRGASSIDLEKLSKGILKANAEVSDYSDVTISVSATQENGQEVALNLDPFVVRYVAKVEDNNVSIVSQGDNKIESGNSLDNNDYLKLVLANNDYYMARINPTIGGLSNASGVVEVGGITYALSIYDSTELEVNDLFDINKKVGYYEVKALTRSGVGSLGVAATVKEVQGLEVVNNNGLGFNYDNALNVQTIALPNNLNVYVANQKYLTGADLTLYDRYEGNTSNALRLQFNTYSELLRANRMVKVTATGTYDISEYIEIRRFGSVQDSYVYTDADNHTYYLLDSALDYTMRARKNISNLNIELKPVYEELPSYVDNDTILELEQSLAINLNVTCESGIETFTIFDPSDETKVLDGTIISTLASSNVPVKVKIAVNEGANIAGKISYSIADDSTGSVQVAFEADENKPNVGYICLTGVNQGTVGLTLTFANGYEKVLTVNVVRQFESFQLTADSEDIDYNVTSSTYVGDNVEAISIKKNGRGFFLYLTADPTFGAGEVISATSNNASVVSVETVETSIYEIKNSHVIMLNCNGSTGNADISVRVKYREYVEDGGYLVAVEREVVKNVSVTVFEPITSINLIGQKQTIYSRDSLGYDQYESSVAHIGVEFNDNASINNYLENVRYEIYGGGSSVRGLMFSQDNAVLNGVVYGQQASLVGYNNIGEMVTATVKLTIDEFGREIVRYFTINIINATRTSAIKIDNEQAIVPNTGETIDGVAVGSVIALKQGEEVYITSTYTPASGITFPGVDYFIRTGAGVYERFSDANITVGDIITLAGSNRIVGSTVAGEGYVLAVARDHIAELDGDVLNISNNPNLLNNAACTIIKFNVTNGTINNPYVITSVDDFKDVYSSKDNVEYYVLGRDISISGLDVSNFSGTFKNVINGYYEGRLNKIKGFTYSNNGYASHGFGLFGEIDSRAMLLNLTLEVDNVNLTLVQGTEEFNLGLLASVNNGLIQNCSVTYRNFNVTGGNDAVNVGSIAGTNNGTIVNYARMSDGSNITSNITPESLLKTYSSYPAGGFDSYIGSGDTESLINTYIDTILASATSLNTVVGDMILSGTTMNVGGIVGNNSGTVFGVYGIYDYYDKMQTGTQSFEFMAKYESQGVDASVNIANTKYSSITNSNVGGIAGISSGSIVGVSAEGSIGYVAIDGTTVNYQTAGNVGGIAGNLTGNTASVSGACASVYISASGVVGGAVGYAGGANITDVKVEIYASNRLGMQASLIRAAGKIGGVVGSLEQGSTLTYSFIKNYAARTLDATGSAVSASKYNGDILVYGTDNATVSTIANVDSSTVTSSYAYINVQVAESSGTTVQLIPGGSTHVYAIVNTILPETITTSTTRVGASASDYYYVLNGAETTNSTYSSDYWNDGADNSSNGGHPVLWRIKDELSLLTLIPQSLEATANTPNIPHHISEVTGGYSVDGGDAQVATGNDVAEIVLLYDNSEGATNTYSLNTILNLAATPSQLRTVRILASTDNSLASVDNNGELHVYGTGSFVIDLRALLNNNACDTVKVEVINAVESFYIGKTSTSNDNSYSVRKDTDLQLYPTVIGKDGSYLSGNYVIKYSGDSYDNDINANNVATFQNNGDYAITAALYYNYNGLLIDLNKTFEFSVSVTEGATDMLVSPIDIVMSPSETPSIEVYLVTDMGSDSYIVTINTSADNFPIKEIKETGEVVRYTLEEMFDLGSLSIANPNPFVIKLQDDDELKLAIDREYTYTFTFTAGSNSSISRDVTVTVIPQVLRSIDVSTFDYNGIVNTGSSGDYATYFTRSESDEILIGPGEELLIEINAYPSYANVKEFRITSDAADDQLIAYKQVVRDGALNGATQLFKDYDSAFVAGGLVLDKVSDKDNNYDGKVYVSVLVSGRIEKRSTFNITVYGVRNDGSEIAIPANVTIYVQEVPNIDIAVEAPNHPQVQDKIAAGTTDAIEFSIIAGSEIISSDIAWDVKYQGADLPEGVNWESNGTSGILTVSDTAEVSVGNKFSISATYAVTIDGRIYRKEAGPIEIEVVDYIITSTEIANIDGNNILEIAVSNTVALQARVGGLGTTESKKDIENKISRLLATDSSSSATWKVRVGETYRSVTDSDIRNSLPFDTSIAYLGNSTGIIYLTGRSSGMTAVSMMLEFVSYYDAGKIKIAEAGTNGTEYRNTFSILVTVVSDNDNPLPIYTEEEFLQMVEHSDDEGSNAHYILLEDLVFDNYTPISTAIDSLDGNNKTITINSFAMDTSATGTVNLGLFDTVAENTILKNLIVVYPSVNDFAMQLTNYDTVNFGGIAAINNGIITNCDVVTTYKDRAASYAMNMATSTTAEANIGGLVGINNNIITNSRVGNDNIMIFNENTLVEEPMDLLYNRFLIKVSGAVALGGFAGTNSTGAIINSSYAKNLQIEAVNGFSTNQQVAGFVAYNSGSIYGSYSAGWEEEDDINNDDVHNDNIYYDYRQDGINLNRRMGGGIFSSYIAGFVYENNSIIADSYAAINLSGTTKNPSTDTHAGGFVYHNTRTGSISTSYSNGMVKNNHIHGPFTGINAVTNQAYNEGTIFKCYYLREKNQKLYEDLEEAVCLNQDVPDELAEVLDSLSDDAKAGISLNNFIVAGNFGGFSFDSSNDKYYEDMTSGAIWAIKETLAVQDDSIRQNNESLSEYGYPELITANQPAMSVRQLSSVDIDGNYHYTYYSGYSYGSNKNPILISTAEQFGNMFSNYLRSLQSSSIQFSTKFTGSIRLINNLDFSALDRIDSTIFEYTSTNTSMSIFDGNNLTMSNLNLSTEEHYDAFGIFKTIYNAAVKNLRITVGSIAASSSKAVGVLAGVVADSDINNIEIVAIDQTSRVTGQNYVGGLAGIIVSSELTSDDSPRHSVNGIKINIPVLAGLRRTSVDPESLQILRSGSIWNRIIPPSVSGVNPNDNELKLAYLQDDVSYAGGVAGVIDLKQNEVDNEGVSTPSLDKVNARAFTVGSYDAANTGVFFNVEAENAGGVFGFVGNQTYVKDAMLVVPVANSDQSYITGRLAVGGITAYNYGRLNQVVLTHIDSSQKSIDEAISTYVNGNTTALDLGNINFFSNGSPKYIGGLVGINSYDGVANSGEIVDSYNRISIRNTNATYVGGIVGLSGAGSIGTVYATGSLTAGTGVGGIIGVLASASSRYCDLRNKALSMNANVSLNILLPEDFDDAYAIKDNYEPFYNEGDGTINDVTGSDCFYLEKVYRNYLNSTLAAGSTIDSIDFADPESHKNVSIGCREIPASADLSTTNLNLRDLMQTQEEIKSNSSQQVFASGIWSSYIWKQPFDRALPQLTYGYIPRLVSIYDADDYKKYILEGSESDTIYFIMRDIDMGFLGYNVSRASRFSGRIYGARIINGDVTRNPILYNIHLRSANRTMALFYDTKNMGLHDVDFQFAEVECDNTVNAASFIIANASGTSISGVNIYSSLSQIKNKRGSLYLYTTGRASGAGSDNTMSFDTTINVTTEYISDNDNNEITKITKLESGEETTIYPTTENLGPYYYKSYYTHTEDGDSDPSTPSLRSITGDITIYASTYGALIAGANNCIVSSANVNISSDITVNAKPNDNTGINVGSLIGTIETGRVNSQYVGNKLTVNILAGSKTVNIGGLIGYNKASIRSDSSYTGEIVVKDGYVAGIDDSYLEYSGEVNIGGLLGKSSSTAEVGGKVSANINVSDLRIRALGGNNRLSVGGLVGYTDNNKITSKSTHVGDISIGGLRVSEGTNVYIGGLFGYLGTKVDGNSLSSIGDVSLVLADDSVDGSTLYVGGAFGFANKDTFSFSDILVDSKITIDAKSKNTTIYSGLLMGRWAYMTQAAGSNLSLGGIYTFGEIIVYGSSNANAYVAGLIGQWLYTSNNLTSVANITLTGDVVCASTLYVDRLSNSNKNYLAGLYTVNRAPASGSSQSLANTNIDYENDSYYIYVLPTIYYPYLVDSNNTTIAQAINASESTSGYNPLAIASTAANYDHVLYNEAMYLSTTNSIGTAKNLSSMGTSTKNSINNAEFLTGSISRTDGLLEKYATKLAQIKQLYNIVTESKTGTVGTQTTTYNVSSVSAKIDGTSKLYPITYDGSSALEPGKYYKLSSNISTTNQSSGNLMDTYAWQNGWTLYANGYGFVQQNGKASRFNQVGGLSDYKYTQYTDGSYSGSSLFVVTGGTLTGVSKPAAVVGMLNNHKLIYGNNYGIVYGCGTDWDATDCSGLAANNHGMILKSFFLGSLTSESTNTEYEGAFVGANSGAIKDCFVNADLVGVPIAGFVRENSGTIKNVYTTAKFDSVERAGTEYKNYFAIKTNNGTLSNVYYDKGSIAGLDSTLGTGVNLYDIMDYDVFKQSAWNDDSANVRLMFNDGYRYPDLVNLYLDSSTLNKAYGGTPGDYVDSSITFATSTQGAANYYDMLYTGSGYNSDADVIQINSPTKMEYYLAKLAGHYRYYKVVKDLDFSAYTSSVMGRWSNPGSKLMSTSYSYKNTGFIGNFNGNDKTLSNIDTDNGLFVKIDGEHSKVTNMHVGGYGEGSMFGTLTNGTVSNITIDSGSHISGTGDTGALFTSMSGGNVNNITLDNYVNGGAVEGWVIVEGTGNNVGGIVGKAQGGTITNVTMKDAVVTGYGSGINAGNTNNNAASAVGGVVGYAEGSEGSTISISTINITGGSINITGKKDEDGTVNNFVNSSTDRYLGGIVGYAKDTTITGDNTIDPSSLQYLVEIIQKQTYSGYIAGYMGDGATTVGYIEGTKKDTQGNYSGGLVGKLEDGTIIGNDSSVATSDISLSLGRAAYGGIVGDMVSGTIQNVKNIDNITTSSNMYLGGIVGHMKGGTLNSVVNEGEIKGNYHIGGIVGYMQSGVITLPENKANVSGYNYVGGIIGDIKATSAVTLTGAMVSSTPTISILLDSNQFNPSRSEDCYIGGAIGVVEQSNSSKSKIEIDITEVNANINIGDTDNKLDLALVEKTLYAGGMIGYAALGVNGTGRSAPDNVFNGTLKVSGKITYFTEGDLDIGSVDTDPLDSDAVHNLVAGRVVGRLVSGTVDLKDASVTGITIGVEGAKFVGGIVGQMSGGTVTSSQDSGTKTIKSRFSAQNDMRLYGGIVGYMSAGTISNITTSTETLSANGKEVISIGGIVGEMYGGSISSGVRNDYKITGADNSGGIVGKLDATSTISGLSNSGTVSGKETAGGIVGLQYNGTLTSCTNNSNGKITAGADKASIGGIAGFVKYRGDEETYSSWPTINNSTNDAKVDGSSKTDVNVGGIAGYIYRANLNGVTNSGTITGTTNVGGVVGYMLDGYITCEIAGGYVDTLNSGTVTGDFNVGGIVGYLEQGRIAQTHIDISDEISYYVKNTGSVSGLNNIGGIVGCVACDSTRINAVNIIKPQVVGSNNIAITSVDTAKLGKVCGKDNTTVQVGGVVGYVYTKSTVNIVAPTVGFNISITHSSTQLDKGMYMGGIVGYAAGTTNINGNISVSGSKLDYEADEADEDDVLNATYSGRLVGRLDRGEVNLSKVGDPTSLNVNTLSKANISGGIVGYMAGGSVKGGSSKAYQLGFDNSASREAFGGVAGYMTGGTIENIKNSGELKVSSGSITYYGGIVGKAEGSTNKIEIKNVSKTSGAISGADYAGGIVGYFANTYADQKGPTYSAITNPVNEVKVTANIAAGGIVGKMTAGMITGDGSKNNNSGSIGSSSEVINSFSGGIVGIVDGGDKPVIIQKVINNGAVNLDGYKANYAGGIVGQLSNTNTASKIDNAVNKQPVWARAYAGGVVGYMSAGLISGDGSTSNNTGNVYTYDNGTSGGIVGGILDSNAVNVQKVVNGGAVGTTDKGSISGGIVGYMDNANTTLKGVSNNANISAKSYAGGLVGYMKAGSIDEVSETLGSEVVTFSSSNSADVTSSDCAGGVVGYMSGGTLKKVELYNDYTSSRDTTYGELFENKERVMYSDIVGNNYSGGIVGEWSGGTITSTSIVGRWAIGYNTSTEKKYHAWPFYHYEATLTGRTTLYSGVLAGLNNGDTTLETAPDTSLVRRIAIYANLGSGLLVGSNASGTLSIKNNVYIDSSSIYNGSTGSFGLVGYNKGTVQGAKVNTTVGDNFDSNIEVRLTNSLTGNLVNLGVFAGLNYGTGIIRNLDVMDCTLYSTYTSSRVGGAVGYNAWDPDSKKQPTIKYCRVYGINVRGADCVGGVAGLNGGIISNCLVDKGSSGQSSQIGAYAANNYNCEAKYAGGITASVALNRVSSAYSSYSTQTRASTYGKIDHCNVDNVEIYSNRASGGIVGCADLYLHETQGNKGLSIEDFINVCNVGNPSTSTSNVEVYAFDTVTTLDKLSDLTVNEDIFVSAGGVVGYMRADTTSRDWYRNTDYNNYNVGRNSKYAIENTNVYNGTYIWSNAHQDGCDIADDKNTINSRIFCAGGILGRSYGNDEMNYYNYNRDRDKVFNASGEDRRNVHSYVDIAYIYATADEFYDYATTYMTNRNSHEWGATRKMKLEMSWTVYIYSKIKYETTEKGKIGELVKFNATAANFEVDPDNSYGGYKNKWIQKVNFITPIEFIPSSKKTMFGDIFGINDAEVNNKTYVQINYAVGHETKGGKKYSNGSTVSTEKGTIYYNGSGSYYVDGDYIYNFSGRSYSWEWSDNNRPTKRWYYGAKW